MTGPESSLCDVRRPALQFDQPIRRLRQDRELGQFPADHGHFIATMKARTSVTILVDLVGKILALCDRESLACEEIRLAREPADAGHPMSLGLSPQRFDQPSASAFALSPGRDRDRANLRQVRAIEMQRAAADDAATIFQNHEVAEVLANFRQSAR